MIKVRIFYPVDLNKDFMEKWGKLYVTDAVSIRPNIKRLTKYALSENKLIIGSLDRHFPGDKELKIHGEHCMDGTEGQKEIPEAYVKDAIYIPDAVNGFGVYCVYTMADLVDMLKREPKKIIFEKQNIDVFTNPNIISTLRKQYVTEAVVYGVATEYCVKEAVLGLLKRWIKVYVVADAIKGMNNIKEEDAVKEMASEGATFVTTEDVVNDRIR